MQILGIVIGEHLRQIREERNLSQGDIEKRTGLLRCYISRVQNGHTVPAVETLEKMARALELPLYQLFHDGEQAAKPMKLVSANGGDSKAWGSAGKDARKLARFRRFLSQTDEIDRHLLLHMAQKMARK